MLTQKYVYRSRTCEIGYMDCISASETEGSFLYASITTDMMELEEMQIDITVFNEKKYAYNIIIISL